jgi:hypothetical protein
MFAASRLHGGQVFPEFPASSQEAIELFEILGARVDSDQDPLTQLTDFAMDHWVNMSVMNAPPTTDQQREAARKLGLIDAIHPTGDTYDHILVDGGSKPVYDLRLNFLDTLLQKGVTTPSVVVFGGQRLRVSADDKDGSLEERAAAITGLTDPWIQQWLDTELSKDPSTRQRWQKPFATEHEIGLLSLIEQHGDRLQHVQTIPRKSQQSVCPEIPAATVHSEVFQLEDISTVVLNAPAIVRGFRGQARPLDDARPTGRSCFREWFIANPPASGADTLLITQNPNAYRSWLDLLMELQQLDRPDIQIEAAAAAIEPDRSHAFVLHSLGRLLVTFYNQKYGYDGLAPA